MFRKPYLLIGSMALWVMTVSAQTHPITDAEALEAGHRIEVATNSGNYYQINHFLVPDSLLYKPADTLTTTLYLVIVRRAWPVSRGFTNMILP